MATIDVYGVDAETSSEIDVEVQVDRGTGVEVNIDDLEIDMASLSGVTTDDVSALVNSNPDQAYDYMMREIDRSVERGSATHVLEPVLERLTELLGAGVLNQSHLPTTEQDPTIEQAVDIISAALKDLLVGKQEKDMTNELKVINSND